MESGNDWRKDAGELLPIVYAELHKLAVAKMSSEGAPTTLQPTALVHEAWLRLGGETQPQWENERHFFAAAAEAMRRILIDRARKRNTLKRGVAGRRIDLDQVDIAVCTDDDTLLRVNDALEKLEREDSLSADLVRLRFFIGLDYGKAAETLGISERSAKRYWSSARAWLYRELREDPR